MELKIAEKVKAVYFTLLAVLMYFFLNEYIDLGLHITFRHAFALAIVVSAVAVFLYRPDIGRGAVGLRDACVYSIPLLVTTVVSLFIWFVNMVETEVITRGISSAYIYTNMLSFALAASSMLYIFGEKGIWYNLAAILGANILIIITIIAENGLGNYFSEFITLIVTFADKTGDIIVKAEVHELAFCIGAYLTYMLYKPEKNIVFLIFFILSMFCFLSAFKRIAIIAIVVALAFGYLLKAVSRFNDRSARRLVMIFTVLLVLVLIGYIAIIKMDAFLYLEKAGINTSGRVGIYDSVDKFYEFHPGFLGNGIGFLTYQLNTNMHIGVASIHNDFLQHYIDLGFFGYIMWLLAITVIRVWYYGRKGRTDSAIVTFMLTLYLIIVSSTDNTMNYPLLTGVLAILMTGMDFDKKSKAADRKILGYK